MSNHVLVERYELGDRLGLGGMAEVYLGKDRVLGRTVAVKTLLTQFAHDPSFIARFRREATSAAQLNHPNIVGVYDSGSDDGRQFIVMEYVEGRTLKDVIREEGPLLPERAAELAAEVCGALQYAHAAGIIHRDIKPANIMLNRRGEVKVTDFGIARAASGETVTQTATVLGTAQYFSPEQAQAAPVDARSDLYSLGVVMYEMLTRQVPFTGASPVAIAYKHVKEDPIPPSRLNADVPPALEAVVMKALSKNADNRYQSAQEMRGDIERAIRGQPVQAPRVMSAAEQTAVMRAATDETMVIRRGGVRPPPERGRRGVGVALLSLIAIGMVGVIIWALIALLPKSPATVAVPGVEGFSIAGAQERLRAAGFRPAVAPAVAHDTIPAGLVIRTDPPAGERVKRGGTVTIIPSAGKAKIKVPNVIGMKKEQAEKTFKDAGFTVSFSEREDANKPPGTVIDTNPKPGSEAEKGSQVTVVVSSGPGRTFVPNMVGDTEADALQQLGDRGLRARVIREAPGLDCAQPDGRVCRQNPEGGTEVDKNSEVTIVVADDSLSPDSSP